jgi:hypothetical protein
VVTPEEVQDWGKVTFAATWAPQPGVLAKVGGPPGPPLPLPAAASPPGPCDDVFALPARAPRPPAPPPHRPRPAPQCTSLKAVMSLGAGVDHMLRDGVMPPGLQLLRIVSC